MGVRYTRQNMVLQLECGPAWVRGIKPLENATYLDIYSAGMNFTYKSYTLLIKYTLRNFIKLFGYYEWDFSVYFHLKLAISRKQLNFLTYLQFSSVTTFMSYFHSVFSAVFLVF